MKTNAIIRIVLFSLALLILLSILGSAMLARNFFIDVRESGVIEVLNDVLTVDDSGNVRIDGSGLSGEYDAAQIRDIKIEWVSGNILIQPGNTNVILFEESAVSDSDYQMVVKCSGDKLTLKFCEENVFDWGTNINSNISKDLVITVPHNWTGDSFEIDTASARVEISDLLINELDFDGASGKLTLDNCDIVDLDIDTASGDVEFTGTLKDLDFDAASARFFGEFHTAPNHLNLDAMSGSLELVLPDYCWFTCELDTVSGSFNTDFATSQENGIYIFGNKDKACHIKISAMSGDVCILKGISAPAENCDH